MQTHQPRYFLCDQSLTGFSGHCFAYFEPLAEIFQARGRQAIIVGNKQLDDEVAARLVVRGFSYLCDQQDMGHGADAIRDAHEAAIARDLGALDDRFGLIAADRIVINSIRHWAIRGVVRWLEALPSARRPRVALLLHFTAQPERFQPEAADRHYRDAFRSIECSPCAGLFRLYADATTLIDEYRTMTALDIALLPFPHSQLGTGRHEPDPGGPIRIGYVGEARYHKGFQFLPFMVAYLNKTDLWDKIEFHVHSFINDTKADFYLKAMPHLRAHSNVVLYPDVLDPQQYEDFVTRCDVIILPYLLTYYHSQTSGIYADSLGLGIPVVVSDGTWMARELKRLGGGVLAAPGDCVSLARATYRLCTDIDRSRRQAGLASEAWLDFNTPGKLADMLEAW